METKWYEVLVTTQVSYLVEVEEDNECFGDSYTEAISAACDEVGEFSDAEATHISADGLERLKKSTESSKILSL